MAQRRGTIDIGDLRQAVEVADGDTDYLHASQQCGNDGMAGLVDGDETTLLLRRGLPVHANLRQQVGELQWSSRTPRRTSGTADVCFSVGAGASAGSKRHWHQIVVW